jgi:hypothetical protein
LYFFIFHIFFANLYYRQSNTDIAGQDRAKRRIDPVDEMVRRLFIICYS